MTKKKSVSVVIPNYNGSHLLKKYLPFTVKAIRNAEVDFEIIVVDDCSNDDSVSFLQQHYPEIKLLVNQQNTGFSCSCNYGIEAARMEIILLLNSDVKLTPDYFDPLWKYFSQPDTFGVMGRIVGMDGSCLQDAARMPKLNGFKLKTAWFYYNQNHEESFTLYLSGANAFIDAKKLKDIGGFNKIFSPFYSEDFELSLRAWRLNWKCYYEHDAVCMHEISASTKDYKTARWVKMIYFRNRFYLHAIHLNGWALILWFLQITLTDILPKMLVGQFWMWKSYREFLRSAKQIKASRLELKRLMLKNHSSTSIYDVMNKIKRSVAGKNLVRIHV